MENAESMLEELPPLIREDGEPYSEAEVAELSQRLSALSQAAKRSHRDANAEAIAGHGSARMLIVSGPGTGKSFLFRSRIKHWLASHPNMRIAVATLVRKLAADLRAEIARDEEISAPDKARIEVNTLHAVARSIVERNHGTTDLPLRPHCRMVGTTWGEELVWQDVFCLHSEAQSGDYPWSRLLDGLYDAELPTEGAWSALRETHLRLQQFYNALTFSDLILLATKVIREKPEVAQDTLFIFDEFQDFNLAEDGLIRVLTGQSPSLLLVGDDDQVLYDQLRRGHASIIRGYWDNRSFGNAMLPYCIRCGFHICKAAEAFLTAGRSKQSIPKPFVSFHGEADAERVKIIAATSPNAGVDYVTELLKQLDPGIRERQQAMDEGREKDPLLLILTPAKSLNYLNVGGARERLLELLAPHVEAGTRSEDYWRARDYYLSADDPSQNFWLRRVMAHEGIEQSVVCELISEALRDNKNLRDLEHEAIGSCQAKSAEAKEILDGELTPEEQVGRLTSVLNIEDEERFRSDLERFPIGAQAEDEERSDLDESGRLSAVRLTSIAGAKGLSADHVLVLGCDDVNLQRIRRSAFFVTLTRARKTLTLVASIGGGGAGLLHDYVVTLPDEHTEALYAKAQGAVEPFATVGELQGHLEKWQYVKEQAKRPRR